MSLSLPYSLPSRMLTVMIVIINQPRIDTGTFRLCPNKYLSIHNGLGTARIGGNCRQFRVGHLRIERLVQNTGVPDHFIPTFGLVT